MSMIGNLARLPAEKLEQLHRQPELISQFLYPSRPTTSAKPKPGLLDRLFGGAKPTEPAPAPSAPAIEPLKQEDALDIEKDWHVLHFLFTGSDWEGDFPQGFLVSCGEPIGDVDVGYGPARSFSPAEVQQISDFLSAQTADSLRPKFDQKRMAELEIYPSIWSDDRDLDEEREFFLEGLEALKAFVKETADRKLALLVYLN